MSPKPRRAKRGGRPAAPGAPAAKSRQGGFPRSRLWMALGLVVVVGFLAFRHREPKPAPDPLEGVSATAAADSADRLVAMGRHFEALPYIERVEQLVPQTDADFEARAATSANNATFQVHRVHGMVIPRTRSSIERIELVRQSMARLEIAERKSIEPVQQRNIIVARAGQLAVWGFMREAYVEYRRAANLADLPPQALSEAGWIEKMLGDPTQVLDGQPIERAAPAPTGQSAAPGRVAPLLR